MLSAASPFRIPETRGTYMAASRRRMVFAGFEAIRFGRRWFIRPSDPQAKLLPLAKV
jgi:hypothetical protein